MNTTEAEQLAPYRFRGTIRGIHGWAYFMKKPSKKQRIDVITSVPAGTALASFRFQAWDPEGFGVIEDLIPNPYYRPQKRAPAKKPGRSAVLSSAFRFRAHKK